MYGLPISVKECFFVKGYDATAGLARYIDSPAEEDGGMVKVSFHFCQKASTKKRATPRAIFIFVKKLARNSKCLVQMADFNI